MGSTWYQLHVLDDQTPCQYQRSLVLSAAKYSTQLHLQAAVVQRPQYAWLQHTNYGQFRQYIKAHLFGIWEITV